MLSLTFSKSEFSHCLIDIQCRVITRQSVISPPKTLFQGFHNNVGGAEGGGEQWQHHRVHQDPGWAAGWLRQPSKARARRYAETAIRWYTEPQRAVEGGHGTDTFTHSEEFQLGLFPMVCSGLVSLESIISWWDFQRFCLSCKVLLNYCFMKNERVDLCKWIRPGIFCVAMWETERNCFGCISILPKLFYNLWLGIIARLPGGRKKRGFPIRLLKWKTPQRANHMQSIAGENGWFCSIRFCTLKEPSPPLSNIYRK